MYKQSPSRNHRSKGIKVKHVLQICVLLAVCLWLIYQVKHSHEKRREFEVKDEKVVEKVQSASELQRFGRKDIPKIMEVTDGEKHEEDDDEKEGEEEENKHDEDESEREDVRVLESEEERGGGDDEIDEHDTEKIETEHEEEVVDEEKEREEKEDVTEENHNENEENEDAHEEGHPEREEDGDAGKEGHTEPEENDDIDKEDHSEQEATSDDRDHDVENTNTQEAQEELYRADDASSEVAHNVQSINSENENVTTDHANEMWGKMSVGQELKTRTSNSADELIKPVILQGHDVNSGISNATITEQKSHEVNLTKSDDSSHQNSTFPEIASNSTIGRERSANLLSNGSQTELDSSLAQNGTVESHGDKEPNLPDNVLEHSVKLEQATDDKKQQEAAADTNKAENVNNDSEKSLSSRDTTLASSISTNDTEAIESFTDVSRLMTHRGKPNESEKAVSDESSESHSYEGTDDIQHDPIDASDTTTLSQEEKESRTDLETLPEIRTEVQNTEDTVAE